jgi:hypothetical protein
VWYRKIKIHIGYEKGINLKSTLKYILCVDHRVCVNMIYLGSAKALFLICRRTFLACSFISMCGVFNLPEVLFLGSMVRSQV